MRFTKILLLCIATLFVACSTPSKLPVFYTPAIVPDQMSYLPKPLQDDSIKVKNYVSVAFISSYLPHDAGSFNMGSISYSRAQALKNLSIAYGASAYFGGTSRDTGNDERKVSDDFYDKGIFGLNLRASVGFTEFSGNTEFRILTWENSLLHESGSYADFRARQRELNDPLIISTNKNTFYTTGASTEIIWRGKKNTDRNYGFRLFLGHTFDLRKDFLYSKENMSSITSDFAFCIKIKNVYGTISFGDNLRTASSKINLGYSF
jgi:hypothetical protein